MCCTSYLNKSYTLQGHVQYWRAAHPLGENLARMQVSLSIRVQQYQRKATQWSLVTYDGESETASWVHRFESKVIAATL